MKLLMYIFPQRTRRDLTFNQHRFYSEHAVPMEYQQLHATLVQDDRRLFALTVACGLCALLSLGVVVGSAFIF